MIGDQLATLVNSWKDQTGARADLAVLQNGFFGPRVRVSGLLTGGDIVANRHRFSGDVVILPSVMLDKSGTRTIDGMSPAEMSAQIGKPVYFAGYLSDVDRIVFETAGSRAA
jgi:NifB/MoaA-like Fe-S oxidoreductase